MWLKSVEKDWCLHTNGTKMRREEVENVEMQRGILQKGGVLFLKSDEEDLYHPEHERARKLWSSAAQPPPVLARSGRAVQ